MFTRRNFLIFSLFSYLSNFFSLPSFAQNNQLKKINKIIPKTGEPIASIGMGTWLTFDIGHNTEDVKTRTKIVEQFFQNGGSLIDSSPMYGSAEKIIGICLKNINQNNKLFSATKVWTPVTKHGEQQIKNSFDLWGQDQFSLIQVHNLVNYKDHLEKLSNLKQQKKIKYIGVTTSHGNKHKLLIDIMNKEDIDFVQFTYNILDDEAEQKLLPLAKEKKIAVIVNRPFQGGSLFDYTKNKQIPKWVKEYGIRSWSEFFLKFTTSHPAVTCSIPATSKLDHMKENMQSLYGDLPDEKTRMKMKQFFKSLV